MPSALEGIITLHGMPGGVNFENDHISIHWSGDTE